MQKSYRIKLGEKEIEILQDENGKFIKPEFIKELEGQGTALKPAWESICVARKPLSEKNVALNVLKWGTGGINIDECRVNVNIDLEGSNAKRIDKTYRGTSAIWNNADSPTTFDGYSKGRFPANLILDEEAGQMLDEQAGNKGAFAPVKSGQKSWGGEIYHKFETSGDDGKTFYGDGLGGASRFFYCAKASKSERNYGCEEYNEVVDCDRNPECYSADVPFNRSSNPKKNNHPTVKPISLMEYLIKLVSRENAIVLDPFLGSGTTAIACLKLNRNFIGIEKEPEYIKIAEARIKPYLEQRKLLLEEKQDE